MVLRLSMLQLSRIWHFAIVAFIIAALSAGSLSIKRKEFDLTDTTVLSPRLQRLFSKTKLACFGRYAIEIPIEAKLVVGSVDVPFGLNVFQGGRDAIPKLVGDDIQRIKQNNKKAEITYSKEGPVENSWQIRYFEDKYDKDRGWLRFLTYISLEQHVYVVKDGVFGKGVTETTVADRQTNLARKFRTRQPDFVPSEPGFCALNAFVPSDDYNEQEMASAGIYFPSFPDVTFSMSSNKDAYGDYSPEEYSVMKKTLSLLYRIGEAKKDQGKDYPYRNVLREGVRKVHHWAGEESLFKRKDGSHDFEWALVGEPMNVAYPAEFQVTMHSKVEYNVIGAATTASLSDSEAVALWDKLLTSLKFRVHVPGAPPGSFHVDVTKTNGK
jgi:hypothetical protein